MGGFTSADALTSLAFVVAGIAIALGDRAGGPSRRPFGPLVAAVGLGSVIQHGPDPAWADLAHDVPLVALIAYLTVDAARDLKGRGLTDGTWIGATAGLAPLIVAAPRTADAAQAVLALVAVALSLQRARVRPGARPTILAAMALLAIGGAIGTLTRIGWPPAASLPGHAVWHVLAAAALWALAPVVGRVGAHATSTADRTGAVTRDVEGG